MEDPLGISSYLKNRLLEALGPSLMESPELQTLERPRGVDTGSFYINPDVEFAFPAPEFELIEPKGPSRTPKGHRSIAHGATEILETPNNRHSFPPRRSFRVDVTETEDEYILRADLAGMSKENVKIDVYEDHNSVNIAIEPPKDEFFGLYKSALESRQELAKEGTERDDKETKVESVEKEKEKSAEIEPSPLLKKETFHLHERCTGPSSRTIKMPQAVDMITSKAEMKQGLLMIKFAKKKLEEVAKKRSIEIK